EVTREVCQFDEIVGRSLPNLWSRRRQLQTLRLGEQPVQPDDLESARLCLAAPLAPLSRRHIHDSRGQRERSQFQTLIAQVCHDRTHPAMVPTFERLIANRVVHFVSWQLLYQRARFGSSRKRSKIKRRIKIRKMIKIR